MRIAFFHELHSGGARRASNEFGSYLKHNHTVDLFIADEINNGGEKDFYNSTHFFKFAPKIWKGGDWKGKLYKDTIELAKLYRLHKKIAGIIDSKHYDLVFVHGSKLTQAPFILRFLKTKTVYYCQENLRIAYEDILGVDKSLPPHKYIYEKLNRFVRKSIDAGNIKRAGLVLTNSNFTKANVYKAYGIRAKTCYMGVNPRMFKPEKVLKENDILYIGAYAFADGYRDLEKALPLLGKYKTALLLNERKWINNDRLLSKLYCKSKLVLALSYNEPFGLVPLEAMASGIPVIAVDEGGYRESVIDGKTGYLVQRDAVKIAEKIKYLLKNGDVLKQMGKQCRENILRHWTWEQNSAKLEKILQGYARNNYE